MLNSLSGSAGYSTATHAPAPAAQVRRTRPTTHHDHRKLEAEQAVLGGLMLDNRPWPVIAGMLTAADFSRADHRLIFSAMQVLAVKGTPFDPVTLADHLEDAGTLAEAGGFQYLGALARDTPSAVNTPVYARIVEKASVTFRWTRLTAKKITVEPKPVTP